MLPLFTFQHWEERYRDAEQELWVESLDISLRAGRCFDLVFNFMSAKREADVKMQNSILFFLPLF